MPINSFLYPGAKFTPAYEVANSLRFNEGSSDTLTRTPSSAGNRRTWTYSAWHKPEAYNNDKAGRFLVAQTDGSNLVDFTYGSNGEIYLGIYEGGAWKETVTNAKHRDVSAWYHLVVAVDTTQSTDSNRVKLYVNGVHQTSLSTSVYPSQNYETAINNTVSHIIGSYTGNSIYYNGYMAEVVLIDGQALDHTSFGEFDSDTNIWKPKDVSGLTFGTNGFYLDFENSGSLGADVSGNGNNFTVNNLTSVDQSTDTCTNNFCTMNPLDYGSGTTSNATFSNGNIIITGNTTDWRHAHGTIGVSQGKWYYEAKAIGVPDGDTAIYIGWCDPLLSTTYNVNNFNASFNIYALTNGRIIFNTSNTDSYQLYADGDILGFALDLDNGKGYISRNGTYYNNNNTSSSPDTNNPDFTITISSSGSGVLVPLGIGYNDGSVQFNFGSPPYSISSGNSDANGYGNFEYAVPSGYYALNTKNLAKYG